MIFINIIAYLEIIKESQLSLSGREQTSVTNNRNAAFPQAVSLALVSRNSSTAINYLKFFFFIEDDGCYLKTHCAPIPLSLSDPEKLTLLRLTKKSPTFTEPESSYPVYTKLSLVPTMNHIQISHPLKPIYLKSLVILYFQTYILDVIFGILIRIMPRTHNSVFLE